MSNVSGTRRAESAGVNRDALRDEILSLVGEPLQEVEGLFRQHLRSPVQIVNEIGAFVRSSGGKRIRPTLHLLCSRLCSYAGPHDVLLATVVEYIHCATLIHDDIIDGATRRRGHTSVNHRWGNDVTVLFGDYMFAKAMQLALQADSLRVMEKLAEVTLCMTEGEMLQTRYVGRLDLTVNEYLDLVNKKTASLFACCCELAGLLAGVGAEREARLSAYGANLGMLFQLVDDLLDLTGDDETLGKPAGSDLREGKATLAVLDLLSTGSAEARRLTEAVVESGAGGARAMARLNELLRESGALERTQVRARDHAERALRALAPFPASHAQVALCRLPGLLLERDR